MDILETIRDWIMAPFAEPALLKMKLGGPPVAEGQNALMVSSSASFYRVLELKMV
jgi:hypothetical protein